MKKKPSLISLIGLWVLAVYAIIGLIDSFVIVIPDFLETLFLMMACILMGIGAIKAIMENG